MIKKKNQLQQASKEQILDYEKNIHSYLDCRQKILSKYLLGQDQPEFYQRELLLGNITFRLMKTSGQLQLILILLMPLVRKTCLTPIWE